nr:energy transducer TonB [uncultured Sphingomonas sp.]
MYQPTSTTRDRILIISGVLLVHLGLAFALINLSTSIRQSLPDEVVEIFDVTEPLPPPPPPPPEPVVVEEKQAKPKPKEAEGAASPKNIKSQASEIKDPKPRIPLPVPQPVKVSETPRQGTDTTQGASNQAGLGTGAGGIGNGTGSGGSGSGSGGGGGGGTGVKLVRGITNRDYPAAIQRSWPRGGRIFVRVRVQPDGRVSQCDVMRSFGDATADQWTCSLILQRGQFRPATDASGRPIAAWFGYVQGDTGRYDR